MRHVLKHRLRSMVIVTLKSRQSFRGLLYDHDTQTIALRSVELLTPGAAQPVDGELIVFVADIETLQIA